MCDDSALNLFDGILYINLLQRKDRKKNILRELKKVSVDPNKVFRIEGLFDELNGSRGCVYSHMRALEVAIHKGWKNVLILEDDCIFIQDLFGINSYIEEFLYAFKNDWDVFFLGTTVKYFKTTFHNNYFKVQFSMRAHAYVVNGHYLSKLKQHYASTFSSLQQDLFFISSLHKALDRQWVDLQLKDRWYCGKKPIVEQIASFSDIEKEFKPQR